MEMMTSGSGQELVSSCMRGEIKNISEGQVLIIDHKLFL